MSDYSYTKSGIFWYKNLMNIVSVWKTLMGKILDQEWGHRYFWPFFVVGIPCAYIICVSCSLLFYLLKWCPFSCCSGSYVCILVLFPAYGAPLFWSVSYNHDKIPNIKYILTHSFEGFGSWVAGLLLLNYNKAEYHGSTYGEGVPPSRQPGEKAKGAHGPSIPFKHVFKDLTPFQ